LLINVFKSEEYVLKGQLTKYNVVTLRSNYRQTYYFAYLDTRDFPDEDEIGLKVTVFDGDLVNTEMWYEGYENVSSQSVLKSRKSYYSSTSSSSYGRTYYDEITYYYKIPKPSKKYLYVSLPFFDGYSYSYAELTVDVISNKIGVIIAIVIAVVVFIVFAINYLENLFSIIAQWETDLQHISSVSYYLFCSLFLLHGVMLLRIVRKKPTIERAPEKNKK